MTKMWHGCCCSVAKSCPTLCDPMDRSTPGFPVLHYLPEYAHTHAHWVSDPIQPSHPLTSFSFCPQSSQHQGLFQWVRSFPMSRLFASGDHSIGASASVLPMNIQDWLPLELTGLTSLQFKGLSGVLSSTTIQKHQSFGTQPSEWSNSHIHTWNVWKNLNFDCMDLCQQSKVSFLFCCLGLSQLFIQRASIF